MAKHRSRRSASATATAPRWRLSTSVPRMTSTRTGLAIFDSIKLPCRFRMTMLSASCWAYAMRRLTIVVPVLDEAASSLARLAGARAVARPRRRDHRRRRRLQRRHDRVWREPLADRVIAAPRGRGAPLNAGAALGTGDALLVPASPITALPDNADAPDRRGADASRLGPLRSAHRRTPSASCRRRPHDQLALAI